MIPIRPFLISLMLINSLFFNSTLLAKELIIGSVEVAQRGFWADDGTVKGSSVEISSHIVEASGYTANNKIMPYPRLLHNLETGEVDVALLVPNDKVTRVATPLVHLQNVDFIIVGNNETQLDHLQDINGRRVGYLRSSRISEKILESLDVKRVEVDKYSHMIQMLVHGRIDALVSTKYNLNYALKELEYSRADLGSELLMRQLELHLVYSKKNTDEQVMAELVKTAVQLRSEGVIQEIIDRYAYSQ